jgi:two-component system, NarL family, sensor histidine kinase UhpB
MFHFTKASASLRTRLILIPPIFLFAGIMVAVTTTLIDAYPDRITVETTSGMTIAGHLIRHTLDNIKSVDDLDANLDRLAKELSNVRHVMVEYRLAPGSPVGKLITPTSEREAPSWFVNWLAPASTSETFPIVNAGQWGGELVMFAEPADEVDEIWHELIFLIGLLSAISVGIASLIWLSTNVALKPLRDLVEGLNRLEKGQFDGLMETRVAELQRAAQQFNRLAKSLARAEADNRLLIDRLMSIQESERKTLARELHDEFGASLFGIRAAASCIVESATANGAERDRLAEIAERAGAISALADTIQKHNYRMLERIRPVVLDQMGLYNALRHLVGAWAADHRGCSCELEMPPGRPVLGEEVSLTIYRIVQECLTNVARHSEATHVNISMKTTADHSMSIDIADDGIGLSQNFRFGFGFLGMSERARRIGGRLKVSNGAKKGTLVEVLIPGVTNGCEPYDDPRTIRLALQNGKDTAQDGIMS